MINFTEQDFIKTTESLPSELQEKILLLSYDDSFVKMINYKTVKTKEIISTIDYATKITALGFASKQEMFELIQEAIGDEEETKHIFEEIDRTILVPNNLQGAKETISEEKVVLSEQSKDQNSNTNETAEDILKEIENPTPAPASIPVFKPEIIVPTPASTQQETPTSMTMPTKEQVIASQQTNPSKESQLNSKLTEPSSQPLKSTYYKIDPYREQTK